MQMVPSPLFNPSQAGRASGILDADYSDRAAFMKNPESQRQVFRLRGWHPFTPWTAKTVFQPKRTTMPTLAETKLHIRVDGDDEDAAITAMIEAAEAAVLDYLDVDELPEAMPVHAAVLMLVGSLYENRESLTDRPLTGNPLFERLLNPYRKWAA